MKNKFLFLIQWIFISAISLYAQNPNDYCTVSYQDSVDAATIKYEGSVPKIETGRSPEIDGVVDAIWSCSNLNIPVRSDENYDFDDFITVDLKCMYDSAWLYILVDVWHDNDFVTNNYSLQGNDYIEILFQNTWGGRRDGNYDHCQENNWWWYYWEQDGDRRWSMPSSKDFALIYDDQDINDDCIVPHPANFAVEEAGWLTIEQLDKVKYGVNSIQLPDDTYRITFEMAFHLRNWLKYDEPGGVTVAEEGHEFGLEVIYWDKDEVSQGVTETKGAYGTSGLYSINDMSWCSPVFISKMTFGSDAVFEDSCTDIPMPCILYPWDLGCYGPYSDIDEDTESQINIYPNPVNDNLKIESRNAITDIELINVLGQVVLRETNSFESIDVSELNEGMYLLRIETGESMYSFSIIKK